MRYSLSQFLWILTDEEVHLSSWNPKIQEWIQSLSGWKYFYQPEKNSHDSILFQQHRTASSACSPSRASIYSGRYPKDEKDTSFLETNNEYVKTQSYIPT